jgi:hypothetical protein
MWYTAFIGDEGLYNQSNRRVRFKLTGNNIHLADFAIIGKLNYRNDSEPNDGIVGAHCENSTISRIWVEHTKVGRRHQLLRRYPEFSGPELYDPQHGR